MNINKRELDRHITGNYGEDQFREDPDWDIWHDAQGRAWVMEGGRLTNKRLPEFDIDAAHGGYL